MNFNTKIEFLETKITDHLQTENEVWFVICDFKKVLVESTQNRDVC
jgi:hypothetical protein